MRNFIFNSCKQGILHHIISDALGSLHLLFSVLKARIQFFLIMSTKESP